MHLILHRFEYSRNLYTLPHKIFKLFSKFILVYNEETISSLPARIESYRVIDYVL
ncbi:hypothetical protein BDB01DRAFT_807497 [Pilobolus umbonatus]|nr:hypothetical protein BDB01DRAFT_807497 [Pilobolus umbonatus]